MNSLSPVFWQNTLPLMVAIVVTVFGATVAGWASNKNLAQRVDDLRDSFNHRIDGVQREFNARFDNVDQRFDEVNRRLERIELKLDSHETRLTALEERTSPLRR